MGKYMEVYRCKKCGKIYPREITSICKKCGEEIGELNQAILVLTGSEVYEPTEHCEEVVAKRGLFGWKVKEIPNP